VDHIAAKNNGHFIAGITKVDRQFTRRVEAEVDRRAVSNECINCPASDADSSRT